MSFHILIFVKLNTKMKSMIDTTAKIAANAQIGKGTIIEEFTVIALMLKLETNVKFIVIYLLIQT